MKTVEIIQLTETRPYTGMSSGRTTGGSQDGTRLVISKNKHGFYYCFDGSSKGNWFESEDVGPFPTKQAAIDEGKGAWVEANEEHDEYY